MTIAIIMPTYGRPASASEAYQSMIDTAWHTDNVEMIWALDADDGSFESYMAEKSIHGENLKVFITHGNMVEATNNTASAVWNKYDILGFVGDDCRFRTQDWDLIVEDTLKHGGIASPDDGSGNIEKELPSHWFVTSDIVRAVGHFANPRFNHFYCDNSWGDIGRVTNSLYWMPDFLLEHLHFSFQKSELDATYEKTMRVGAGDNFRYDQWRSDGGFGADVEKARKALSARESRDVGDFV